MIDLKDRTKKFAVDIILFSTSFKKTDEMRIVLKQIVRSAFSVGANYRASTRARSPAEHFAKMCVVV
jgi:four helix bundle protein